MKKCKCGYECEDNKITEHMISEHGFLPIGTNGCYKPSVCSVEGCKKTPLYRVEKEKFCSEHRHLVTEKLNKVAQKFDNFTKEYDRMKVESRNRKRKP